MTSRLTRIDMALAGVVDARLHCPFHPTYVGIEFHAVNDACKKCGARRNGSGGRCIIDRANNDAILEIERALA